MTTPKRKTNSRSSSQALSRVRLLLGDQAMDALRHASVIICGVGGVGSWAAEALARSGVGQITLVDFDKIVSSNINRQAHATRLTLGRRKTGAMKERLETLGTGTIVRTITAHLTPNDVAPFLDAHPCTAVIDAIDERPTKLQLLQECVQRQIPVVASMGAASKRSSDGITAADISQTIGCPLAKLVRKELRRRGITTGIQCVFSPTQPQDTVGEPLDNQGQRRPLGSIMTVTAAFGLRCAEEILRIITEDK